MKNNKLLKNTMSLYIMNIAKIILPLFTLPYLTRVLSKECYGMVSYVKAFMVYIQMIVDFGFLLSGTKDIVRSKNRKDILEQEISDILCSKVIMCLVAGIVMVIAIFFIPLLQQNNIYTILSFIVVFLTCFLFDYFFRGIEQMQVIAIRFIVMKSIATILTFIFIKNDNDVLWIPIIDILASIIAILLIFVEISKRNIHIRIPILKNVIMKLKDASIYFISDIATTAFGALNTLLVGIYCTKSQVADWSLCIQMVSVVQSMYTPLTNGIYPEMVRSKDIRIIKNILKMFVPLVMVGCMLIIIGAEYVLLLVGGKQYMSAVVILKSLTPVLFFSFPAMMFGWPTLGAIGRIKETTKSTVITALIQILGLIILIMTDKFTLINIAFLRCVTEFLLFVLRASYFVRYRKDFSVK